jgi:beta-lactamase regulating signal transducer with metallopeptidase domain
MKIAGIPVRFDARCKQPAVARGFWPRKYIAVGPAWYLLDAETRVSVLFHEVHHCRALHLEARVLLLPLLLLAPRLTARICRAQELACDRHAAAQGWGHELVALLEREQPDPVEQLFYPSPNERARAVRAYLEEYQPCSNA